MTKLQELKWFTQQARTAGYKVNGGSNGGGWIRLAATIGVKCGSKKDARFALRRRFGDAAGFPRHLSGPVTVIQSNKKKRRFEFAATDAFLSSYEWRRVRMEAIKKYGARCQCCGATPADGVKMNVDHIKPRKIFPQLALDVNNLQVLCEECNHGKGNWDMTDWRPHKGLRPVQDIYGPEIERMCDDAMAHMRSIAGEK
jgi:hypothetical protein